MDWVEARRGDECAGWGAGRHRQREGGGVGGCFGERSKVWIGCDKGGDEMHPHVDVCLAPPKARSVCSVGASERGGGGRAKSPLRGQEEQQHTECGVRGLGTRME